MRNWEKIPECIRSKEVKYYYNILKKRQAGLWSKRFFDVIVSLLLIVLLSPVFLCLALFIKMDSKGAVLFRQVRVTQYGKRFRIFKFRTMVENAEQLGTQVTTQSDIRVTKIGKILRKYRLDELPQLLNILCGDMSFVGTRPEVEKYVERYTDEMKATLLLPAGVTSKASIRYKDEEQLLQSAKNADETYVEKVLPEKMKYNLEMLENYSFFYDIKIMLMTVIEVVK